MSAAEHGTYAAYAQHQLGGWRDPPCDACKVANASYMRLYRASRTTRCKRGLGWPERLTGRALAVMSGGGRGSDGPAGFGGASGPRALRSARRS